MVQSQSLMQALSKPETKFTAKTISGEELVFRIIHWSPTKVFSRISLVGKYFAVPIAMIGDTSEEFVPTEVIPAALVQLFNTMDENNFLEFLGIMLDDVHYQNQPVIDKFDEIFLGKNELVLQIISKVLEVNYGPFIQTGFASLMTSIVPVTSLTKTS